MYTPEMLEVAIRIAANAHGGQLDKAGQPYILHPLRVMFSMFTLEEKIVAVLHDVVEDTAVCLEDLANIFPEEIVNAVETLSHLDGEDYEMYIQRIAQGPSLAKRVKMADLRDNMNRDRIPFPSERDLRRWAKYGTAYKVLTS